MTRTELNWIAMIAVVSQLAACGAEERDRRHPVSFSNDGSRRTSDDVIVAPDDPAALEALKNCTSTSYVCQVEAAIISYTNGARASQGMEPMNYGAKLGFAARHWSQAQAEANAISHEGFPTAREAAITAEFGEDHGTKVLGENVASNVLQQNAQETGKALTNQWWNSPAHKNNVLGDYPALGVGISVRGNRIYATQLFGRDPVAD